MLAYHQSPIALISSQPPHVQRDPLGESRDSVFTRRFFGKCRVQTLALPADRPGHLMDIVYGDCRNRSKNGCFKKFQDFLNVAVFSVLVETFEFRRSPVGLPRSLDVAAGLPGLAESLMTRIEQQGSRRGWVTRSRRDKRWTARALRIPSASHVIYRISIMTALKLDLNPGMRLMHRHAQSRVEVPTMAWTVGDSTPATNH